MKKLLILIFCMLFFGEVYSQKQSSINKMDSTVRALTTELNDSKIASYVRVVGSNLTSSTNGLQVKFALIAFKDSLQWDNANLYLTRWNRFLRYTNVSAGITHQGKFNDATLQTTFTLYNRRDSSVYSYTNPMEAKEFLEILQRANDSYYHYLKDKGFTDDDAMDKSKIALKSETGYIYPPPGQEKPTKNPTDPAYLKFVNDLAKVSSHFKGMTIDEAFASWQKAYKDFAAEVARKPLWTIYPYASYDYTYSAFDKVGFGTTYLISLVKDVNKKPLQLDIEGSAYFANDTTMKAINLNQKIGSLSVGINRVMGVDQKGQPKFEMSFSGQIQHNLEMNAKQKTPSADLTFKYKIFKNFWIPLDIKYDSSKKSIFGFLSITSNLGKS